MLESAELAKWLSTQGEIPWVEKQETLSSEAGGKQPITSLLCFTAISMLVAISLFEILKHLLVPDLTIWQSHIITILFAVIVGTLSAYLAANYFRRLNARVLAEMTQRHQAEQALRINASFVSRLTNMVPALISYVDPDMRYRFVNRRYEEFYQRPVEQIVGKLISQMMDEELFAKVKNQTEMALQGHAFSHEFTYVNRHGQERHGRSTYVPDYDDNGQVRGIFVMNFDVTDFKVIENDLRAKQEQLTAMAMELELVEERERRKIAGELHDQVGQYLVLSRIKLNSLLPEILSEAHAGTIEEVSKLLERAIQDVRSLTLQLSPPVLTTVGLEAALMWLGEQLKADYGLQVTFQDDGQPKPLRDEVRTAIFQTVRELLINVAKHAGCKNASIACARVDGNVNLIIEDEGAGFDISEVSLRKGREAGFGLFNIRQKIEYLGGKLLVASTPGQGTRTVIMAPLS